MATDDDEPRDENTLDDLWRGEQTQDNTEDQTVDQTRDRTLDQGRGPTGNQGIDPTRLRAKDEEVTVIDPMEEAKSDSEAEIGDERPQFKIGDEAADEGPDEVDTDTGDE